MVRSTLLLLLAAAAGCADGPPATESATQPVVVGGAHAGGGSPSGAFAFDGLYLAFTGTDERINIVVSHDGGATFSSPRTLDERAPNGASLVYFDGELHLAWFGSDGRFNSVRSDAGLFWTNKQTFAVNHSANRAVGQPALVVYEGSLRAFYAMGPRRNDYWEWEAHGEIHQRIMGSNKQWAPAEGFKGLIAGNGSPSAAAHLGPDGDLLVAWLDRFTNRLRTKRHFRRDGGWAETNSVDRHHEGTLWVAPTADESPAQLYWLYREAEGPEKDVIKLDRTANGVDFEFLRDTGHTSDSRPFLLWGVSDGVAFTHYGRDGNRSLNYNWVQL